MRVEEAGLLQQGTPKMCFYVNISITQKVKATYQVVLTSVLN